MQNCPNLFNAASPRAAATDLALMRYVQGLEGLFITLRGRGVQWSPRDSDLAVRWYRSGVELATIARVLTEASAAWRYRHGDDALPRSLSWVKKAVERTSAGVAGLAGAGLGVAGLAGAGLAGAGSTAQAPIRTDADVLQDLAATGAELAAAHPDPAAQRALASATRCLARWQRQDGDAPELLDRLARLRVRLVKAVLAGIGERAAAELRAIAEGRLPAGLGGRVRAAMRHHELSCALDRAYHIALPYGEGWRHPSADVGQPALIAPRPTAAPAAGSEPSA